MSRMARMFENRLAALCVGAILCLTAAPAVSAASALAVHAAWARATPPGAGTAAVYLTIVGGPERDRLVSVSTTRASLAQVHSIINEAGMTRMREAASVTIPAGESIVLAPQGMHIMLMGLTQPLAAGERFTLTLEFAAGGKHDVTVAVLPPTATGPAAR